MTNRCRGGGHSLFPEWQDIAVFEGLRCVTDNTLNFSARCNVEIRIWGLLSTSG